MGLQERALHVQVIGHIVQDDVLVIPVYVGYQAAQFFRCTIARVQPGHIHRPVTVIAGKAGIGILVESPDGIGVLCYRGYPQGIHPECIEIPLAQLRIYAGQVAAVIIGLGQHVRTVGLPVIGGVAVDEAVYHYLVHNPGLAVSPFQFRSRSHHSPVAHGHEDIASGSPGIVGIDTDIGAFHILRIVRDMHGELTVLAVGHEVVVQKGVLPQDQITGRRVLGPDGKLASSHIAADSGY